MQQLVTTYTLCCRATDTAIYLMREELKSNGLRKEFLQKCLQERLQELGPLKKYPDVRTALMRMFRRMEIHHIKPLFLGGCNYWKNLALVEPSLHNTIHTYIAAQCENLPCLEKQLVLLPIHPQKKLVWGLENTIIAPPKANYPSP